MLLVPMITSDHGSATSVSPFIRATQNYPQNVLIMSGSAFSHAPPQRSSRVLGRFAADEVVALAVSVVVLDNRGEFGAHSFCDTHDYSF